MARRNTLQEDAVLVGLNEIKEIISRHTEADDRNFTALRTLLEGNDTALGMKIRLDRLEQLQAARLKQVGYLWSAIGALAVGAALKLWLG